MAILNSPDGPNQAPEPKPSFTDRIQRYANNPNPRSWEAQGLDPLALGFFPIALGSIVRDLTTKDGDPKRGRQLLMETVAPACAARLLAIPLNVLGHAVRYMQHPEGTSPADVVAQGMTRQYFDFAKARAAAGDWEVAIRAVEEGARQWTGWILGMALAWTPVKPFFHYIEEVRGTKHERSTAELVATIALPTSVVNMVWLSASMVGVLVTIEWDNCPYQIAPEIGAVSAPVPILTAYKSRDPESRFGFLETIRKGSELAHAIEVGCPNVDFSKDGGAVHPPSEDDFYGGTEVLVQRDGRFSTTASFYDPGVPSKDRLILTIPTEDKNANEACISAVAVHALSDQIILSCLWSLDELPRGELPELPEKLSAYHFTVSCGPRSLPNAAEVQNGAFEGSEANAPYFHNLNLGLEWTAWGGTRGADEL